jgi:hypothetical protein
LIIQEIKNVPKVYKSLTPKALKDLDSDSDPEDGYLRKEERQEQTIAVSREKIYQNFKSESKATTQRNFKKSPL